MVGEAATPRRPPPTRRRTLYRPLDDKGELKMKKVYIAQGPIEGYLIKGFLEAQGIPAIVRGENRHAIRGGIPMTSDTLPSVWILQDADFDRVRELSDNLLDCCGQDEMYSRSEAYVALSRVLAIILLDAGRAGREPEHIKNAACEMMSYWVDAIDAHVRSN